MDTSAQTIPPAETARVGRGVLGPLAVVLVGSIIALLAGTSMPALVLALLLGIGALRWVASAPLRRAATALLFGMLGLDETVETAGKWHTPLAVVTDLLHYRIDFVTGFPGLAVTGMEVAVAVLLGVWGYRRSRGSRVDDVGRVPVPSILRNYLVLYVCAVALALAIGVANGYPVAPWKVRNLLHPVLLVIVFLVAYRGPVDDRTIGRVVIAAACSKAALAFVIQRVAVADTGGPFQYATSHGDSILFAVATTLLMAEVLEHRDVIRLAWATLLLPLILGGMVQNNRRIAWVMVAAAAVLAYAVSPMRGWKRTLTRMALIMVPLLAVYVAVGWGRPGKVFAPVNAMRTVSDTQVDRSAYWREVENWNLAMSLRHGGIIGLGLGAQYTEYMANDDITGGSSAEGYKEYRGWPHNSILGMLLLMGILGYTAIAALASLAVFWAARSYRSATLPGQRVAALGCLSAVVSCQILAWGDTGSHYAQYKVFSALAIAVSARLAVDTRAWPVRRRPRVASGVTSLDEGTSTVGGTQGA